MIMYIAYFGIGIVFEIPSGAFADLFGRRKALFYGTLLYLIGVTGFILSPIIGSITGFYFIWFLISEIISGIGHALESGADTAYLYDTLKSQNRENEFQKNKGYSHSVSMVSVAIASFAGSLIANYGLDKPFYFTLIATTIAILVTFSMNEPKHFKKQKTTNYWQHQKENFIFTLKHKEVRWLSLYYGLMFALSLIGFTFFFQLYLQHLNISLNYFSLIYPSVLLFGALASAYSSKIEKFFGEKVTTFSLPLILAASFILMSLTNAAWGIIFMFLIEAIFSLVIPINDYYMNTHLKSKQRATVLSVRNFFAALAFIIFSPIIGYFGDHVSIESSLLVTGLITLGAFVLLVLTKNKNSMLSSSIN